MKRIVLFLLIMIALGVPASSQTHYRANISVGAKAGADLSRVFFNPSVRQKMTPGFTGGFMFRYVEEAHFGLQAELNFAQRGWTENFEEAPYDYKRTINYMELPVMAHIYFGRRGRFFFNAGPQIGLCLGESTSANFDPADMDNLPGFPTHNRENEQMTLKVTQKIDFGICAGLGGEFNINRRNAVNLEVRFYYGLGNIFKAGRQEAFRGCNQMSLSATIGYLFRIR